MAGLGVRRTLSALANEIAEAVLPPSQVVSRQEPKAIEGLLAVDRLEEACAELGQVPNGEVLAKQDEPLNMSLHEAERNIEGLLAVGVPLGEAIASFTGLTMAEAVDISFKLAPSGLANARSLYEIQKGFEDKKAFGALCMERGFNPIGVGLCVICYVMQNGMMVANPEMIKEAQGLIRNFGVDTWVADALAWDWLWLKSDEVCKFSGETLVLPCDVKIIGRTTATSHCITEVEGMLHANEAKSLNLPELSFVGGYCSFEGMEDLSLPGLLRVGSALDLAGARHVDAANLAHVGGDLKLGESSKVVLSNLIEVKGDVCVTGAKKIDMSKLARIGGMLFRQDFEDLKSVPLPALRFVNGESYAEIKREEGL